MRPVWDYAAEGLFAAGMLALVLYFLWEQRGVIVMSFVLLIGLILIMQWLFRPFGRVLHLWMPWIFLFRLLRKR